MKPRTLTLITAIALFAALAIPVGLGAQDQQQRSGKPQQYKLEILDTLGGTFGLGAGLNNRGSVAGFASLPEDSAVHAFLWQNGIITDLGTLGAPTSITTLNVPVNDRGMVVGSSSILTPDPNGEDFCGIGSTLICLPFVWQKGVMTALPLLGGNNGSANGINNRGQIVGLSETPNYDPCSFASLQVEAVIWKDGNLQELPPFPGDAIGNALAVNDDGQAVGATGCVATNTVRAVLWPKGTNGGVIDLGNLGGTDGNIAFAINNQGQVVGQSDLPGDALHHAFLWQNGVMMDLGSLPGLPTSLANGVNNQGQVVGFSQATGDDSSSVAFLWENGTITDLNNLIPPSSPLYLKEALGINDRGQIAGYGLLSNGEVRAFLLTPCN